MNGPTRCVDPTWGRLLAAYELGLLSHEDQTRLEDHIAVCPACLEDLYELSGEMITIRNHPARVAARIESERALRSRSRGPTLWERVAETVRSFLPADRSAFGWRRLMPAGAVLAILLALLLQRPAGTGWEEVADLRPVPYVSIETRGGTAPDAERLFREGIDLYLEGRYRSASASLAEASRLASRADVDQVADQAAFFAGLSFLLSRQADSASTYLDRSARSEQPVIADRSIWYLAQASLLRQDPDRARELLEKLAAGSPGYAERAAQQLERIEKVRTDHDGR